MKIITTLLCAAHLVSFAHSAAVNTSNFDSALNTAVIVTTTNGTPLPNNSGIVAIGFFDETASRASSASISEAFTVFGSSIKIGGADAANADGIYSSNIQQNIPLSSNFVGKTIYTIIGNGSTIATSDQILVYKHNGETFVADNPVAPLKSALLKATPADILIGSVGGPISYTNADLGLSGTSESVRLAVIPEPSIAGLSLLALGLIRRRRK